MEDTVKEPSVVEKAVVWAKENEIGSKLLKVLPWVAGAFVAAEAFGAIEVLPEFDEPFWDPGEEG